MNEGVVLELPPRDSPGAISVCQCGVVNLLAENIQFARGGMGL